MDRDGEGSGKKKPSKRKRGRRAPHPHVHPVVKLKVGPYAENKTRHRECEIHQDAYIFPRRLNLGTIGLAEHLTSGIGQCGQPGHPDQLDTVGLTTRS